MILIIVVLLGFCIIIINKNINNKNDSLPTINIYNDNNEIDYYVFETNWYDVQKNNTTTLISCKNIDEMYVLAYSSNINFLTSNILIITSSEKYKLSSYEIIDKDMK